MEPIHQAAYDGDAEVVERLVAQDRRRLNAQIQGEAIVGGYDVHRCTTLMLAAGRGHDAVVTRLLALGADVGLESRFGYHALDYAARANHASALALLIDASAPINSGGGASLTPLMHAAMHGSRDCVALLITRGGNALDIDAASTFANRTALHWAASFVNTEEAVQLFVLAGANPTLRDWDGLRPLDRAHLVMHEASIDLLEAATVEHQRPRLLLKVRALLDAAHAIEKARADARDKDDSVAEDERQEQEQEQQQQQQQDVFTPRRTRRTVNTRLVAVAPLYLKQRMAQAWELPRVRVVQGPAQDKDDEEEKLVACLKYALGLEGGGGVVVEGQKPAVGMVKGVFVELCELLVPKWDRANV